VRWRFIGRRLAMLVASLLEMKLTEKSNG